MSEPRTKRVRRTRWAPAVIGRSLMLVLVGVTAQAGAPNVEWERTIGDPVVSEYAAKVVQTADSSGYVVAGRRENDELSTSWDALLVKVSPKGDTEWERRFHKGGYTSAQAVLQTPDGDFVVGGAAYDDPNLIDGFLMRTDPDGNELSSVLPHEHFLVRWLQETEDGEFIAGGRARENPPAFGLLKTDASFKKRWFHVYDFWETWCVCWNWAGWQTRDGGFVLLGSATLDGPPYIAMVWVDENGNQERSKLITPPPLAEYTTASGGCEAHDGGCIIVGQVRHEDGNVDVYLLKTDENGDEEWSSTFGGEGNDVGACVSPTGDGGYIIAGEKAIESGGGRLYLVKTDGRGTEEWSGTFGPPMTQAWYPYCGSAVQTSDGGYIAVDTAPKPNTLPLRFDIYIVKLAPEVPQASFERGNTNADDTVNLAGAVCLLGYLFGSAGEPCKETVAQCLDAADANDDGRVNIADAVAVLSHLFAHTGPLPGPFGACGIDPTTDELGCAEYVLCQ
jgi:hypothetical protein